MLLEDICEMASADLSNVEHDIDQMFRDIGLDVIFTQHFKNRLLDAGQKDRADHLPNSAARDTDVSSKELYAAFAALKSTYGKSLLKAKFNREEFTGILKDMTTKLNIPFVIDYDRVYSGLHKLTASTIMRKGDFKPNSIHDKVLPVKSQQLNK
jgi:hypothetical protein